MFSPTIDFKGPDEDPSKEFSTRQTVSSSSELKARVSYCHGASFLSVCLSSVVRRKLFAFSTSPLEPFDGIWWNLVGIKYSWSLTIVVYFDQICPDADSGRAKISHGEFPSSKYFTFRLEGCSKKKNECIAVIYKQIGRRVVILVPFWSQILTSFRTLLF